jgi:hypothetical protein
LLSTIYFSKDETEAQRKNMQWCFVNSAKFTASTNWNYKKGFKTCFQYCKIAGQYINNMAVLLSHDAKFSHLHKYLFIKTSS